MIFFIILFGFLVFMFSLCIHVLIWRLRPPKDHPIMLMIVFFLIPIIIFLSIICFLKFGFFKNIIHIPSPSIIDLVSISLLQFSLSSAYILTYPAVQARCPSLGIILYVKASMPNGLSHEELMTYFEGWSLSLARIQDLIDANLVIETNGSLELTRRGILLIRFFILLRRLLGLPIGGG